MTRQRRSFPAEFKQEVARLVLEQGYSVTETSPKALLKWLPVTAQGTLRSSRGGCRATACQMLDRVNLKVWFTIFTQERGWLHNWRIPPALRCANSENPRITIVLFCNSGT